MPRAFIVHAARHFGAENKMASYIQQNPEYLKTEVLLEKDPEAPLQTWRAGTDSVTIGLFTPNRIRFEVESGGEGYLVISQSFSPDWSAELDGQKVILERANYAFSALKITEGNHSVIFTYRPVSLKRGLALSAGAVVLWAIVLVFLL